MIRYGHESILEEFLDEHNEKVILRYERLKKFFLSELNLKDKNVR